MLIIDAHLDLGWNALQWNRDLQLSAHTIRSLEAGKVGAGYGQGTVALPELRRGRIALCFATLLARSTGQAVSHLDYASSAQAFSAARGQLAYYRALEKQGQIRIITERNTLDQHINEWSIWDKQAAPDSIDSPPPGLVISMESADPILDPGELGEWWEAGVRLIGPAHYGPGRYAGGTATEEGLTAMGRELLKQMQRSGVILDTTHLSDPAFWEAVALYDGLIIASHNNCRALVPHQRQFSDEQLRVIIERRGVIGGALDAWMMQPGWIRGVTTNEGVRLEHIVDHIDHICQLSGNSQHAAIGSDLDGGFGREQSPHDLDTIADLQRLVDVLARRGYQPEDIANIMHRNWLRVLYQVWQ